MCAVVVVCLCACVSSYLVDNTKPRTDTDGNIVNAHQGHMTRFQQVCLSAPRPFTALTR
jgi:hypothetical protein